MRKAPGRGHELTRGGRGTALGAARGLAAVRSDDRGPAHMPRALRPKLGPPPDGYWIGSRTTRLNREPTHSYAGNGRACRSLTARGGGFLWIEARWRTTCPSCFLAHQSKLFGWSRTSGD